MSESKEEYLAKIADTIKQTPITVFEEPVICETLPLHISRSNLSAESIHFRRTELLNCLDVITKRVQATANEMPYDLIEKYNKWIEEGYELARKEGCLYAETK